MKKQKFLKRILSTFIAAALAAMCCVSAFASTIIVDGWEFAKDGTSSAVICGADDKTELVFPDTIAGRTVTAIADYAFINQTGITLVDFSNAPSLSTISNSAFSGCTGITELTLPTTITSLGALAFSGCTELESLTFNAQVSSVPMYCFFECSALTTVTLPDTVTSIGEWAFADCTALTSVTIPASVTSIADDAFLRDDNLVIWCYKGSYAQTYAEENGIDYELIDAYHRGDVNRDRAISIDDATLVQKYIARIAELDDEQLLLADADNDGSVNIKDVTNVQKHIVGISEIVD